jgi:DDE superfamily endonuclease
MYRSICMDGSWIPPTIIYKAQPRTLMDTWIQDLDEAKHKAHFASSPTGWTNDDLGFEWLTAVFDRYTKSKARQGRDWRMLILDGHGSHVNMRFIDGATNIVFSSRCYLLITHRLQPLDVSLFGPLS